MVLEDKNAERTLGHVEERPDDAPGICGNPHEDDALAAVHIWNRLKMEQVQKKGVKPLDSAWNLESFLKSVSEESRCLSTSSIY